MVNTKEILDKFNEMSEDEIKLFIDYVKDVYISDFMFKEKFNYMLNDLIAIIINENLQVQKTVYSVIDNEQLAKNIISELNYRKLILNDISCLKKLTPEVVEHTVESVLKYLILHPASFPLLINYLLNYCENMSIHISESEISGATKFIFNTFKSLFDNKIHPELKKEELISKFFKSDEYIVEIIINCYYKNLTDIRLAYLFLSE